MKILLSTCLLILLNGCIKNSSLPLQFVYLHDIDPSIIEDVRYHSDQNFLGHSVPGYNSTHIICTRACALQLKEAHRYFKKRGYQLVVYDGYRPQVAVDSFHDWAQNPRIDNLRLKQYYYPTLSKKDISNRYIKLNRSAHSRGSTFDLTLIPYHHQLRPIKARARTLNNGDHIVYLDDHTVDMGSSFDLFHPASFSHSNLVSPQAQKMRKFLRQGMKKFGFRVYPYEWWHFEMIKEPYPRTYFNFF